MFKEKDMEDAIEWLFGLFEPEDYESYDDDEESYRYHALAAWKPWATELLSFYMNGTQKQITKVVSERHGVSEQLVRRWKRNFEQFVIDFLAK